MNTQEQQMLQDLFQRLQQAQGAAKDPQASAEIRAGLAAVPDAPYWLAQRTLLLEQALQQAQQQITQLQQQLAQHSNPDAGSFLSGGLGTQFGRNPQPAETFGRNDYASPAAQPAPSSWRERLFGAGTPTQSAPTQNAAAPAAGSSFLGTAASAAAGVAGGMFLFNGLENLMGGHHGGNAAGGGTGNSLWGNNAGQPEVQENVTQNFYGNDDKAGVDQLAKDAGREHMFDGGSDSNDSFDSSDSFDDDSFA